MRYGNEILIKISKRGWLFHDETEPIGMFSIKKIEKNRTVISIITIEI